MSGVLFTHTFRRGLRPALIWGIGLLIYGFYGTAIIPDVDALQQYTAVMETIPPAMLQVFGVGDDMSFMTTPAGFISFGFFGYIMLFLAVYAVSSGLNVIASEEDQGIMDVMLSLPLPRWRVIIERFAAYTLLSVGVVLMGFVGLVSGLQFSELVVDTGRLLEGSLNILPSMLLIMSLTVFVTAVIRNRNTATAIAAGFVIVSYFLNVIGSAASGSIAGQIARLSFFYYYANNEVMQYGLMPVNMLGLLAVTLLLVVGGVWAFQRRDVGI